MKKLYGIFAIFSVLLFGAVGAGAFFLWSFSPLASLALLLLGGGAWAAALLRFKSLEYLDNGEFLTVRRGYFIRAETSLKKSGILYVTTVKFGSVTLFSVLHTASGAVVVFADFALKSLLEAEF